MTEREPGATATQTRGRGGRHEVTRLPGGGPPPARSRPPVLSLPSPQAQPHSRGAAVVLGAVLLAAIFLPSSWGSSAPAPAAPPEQPDPAVAVVPAVDSAGFFVALYEGLFTGHSLHVHFVPAVSSETVLGA